MERADCQPAVQAAFEAAGWVLDGQVHKEKLYYPAETPLVSALLEVYRDATGDNAPPKCIGGGTYARHFPYAVSFGPEHTDIELPEFAGPMHGANEGTPFEKLIEALKIYILALLRLQEIGL